MWTFRPDVLFNTFARSYCHSLETIVFMHHKLFIQTQQFIIVKAEELQQYQHGG